MVGANLTAVKYNGTSWTDKSPTYAINFSFSGGCLTASGTIYATVADFSGAVPAQYRNLFYSRDGGASWSQMYVTKEGVAVTPATATSLYSAYFLNEQQGWVCGVNASSEGKVFVTTNEAASWSDISPANASNITFRDIRFLTSSEGWVVGGDNSNNGYVFHTLNGGATWEMFTSPNPAQFRRISVVDGTNAWTCDRGTIYRYNGSSWQEEGTPLTPVHFNGVSFIDRYNGWAVGGLLATETGGPKRSIYKYKVDPDSLAVDKTFYIASVTTEVSAAFSGSNIQSNAILTIEAASGLTVTTYEVVFDSVNQRNKIAASVEVEPTTARAGSYYFYITNPLDNRTGRGSFTVTRSVSPETRPTSTVVAAQVFRPNVDNQIRMQISTPGQLTQSALWASAIENVDLELIVYRFEDGTIAYRQHFTAEPDGYTTVTLQKVTDLGLDISEGVYNAVVIHPRFGKIGSGLLVVHYTR
jgi:hypothetical protein